jgi:hypothetical protein
MGLNKEENSKVQIQDIEHNIEPLIVNLAVFCFKRGLSIDKFVDVIENMLSLEHKTKIPFDQLPDQLLQQQRDLESIEKEKQEIKHKKRLLLIEYNTTIDTLEEYKTNRPSYEKYIKLKKELEEIKRQRNLLQSRIYELEVKIWMMKYDWKIPTGDIDLINSNYNSRSKLTEEQLLKMAKDLVNHPRKYVDIICSIKERYLEMAEVNNNIVQ